MAKRKDRNENLDYDDDAVQALFGELDLDDDAFFEQFQVKSSRKKSRRTKNARRRIEEYQEERDLAWRLREYYDDED